MKKLALLTLALCLLGGAPYQAFAHVNYIDLSDPVISPGGVNGSAFQNNGWYLGTTSTLGDSHALAGGDYFKFHIGPTAAKVTITFSDNGNPGLGPLNPAFSVYAGLFPDEAHDDTTVDPLQPTHFAGGTVYDPSPVDNGVTRDGAGRVSPFRNTAAIHNFVGQFDATHSWSMANVGGNWGVVQYVTHVPPSGGSSVTLSNYLLPPGDYTIAAAGGNAYAVGNPSVQSGLAGTIHLTVTPVPNQIPLPTPVLWILGAVISAIFIRFANSRKP